MPCFDTGKTVKFTNLLQYSSKEFLRLSDNGNRILIDGLVAKRGQGNGLCDFLALLVVPACAIQEVIDESRVAQKPFTR